jgi:protein gp37
MSASKIEWTEHTWNPVTGCSKISSGCKNCYAESFAKRLQAMGVEKYNKGFGVSLHREELLAPYQWKKPRIVFVNSMSDMFHERIPFEFVKDVFTVMNDNPRHIFQVLTKRSGILFDYARHLSWTNNIWMGVSVESMHERYRIDHLRSTNAAVKFLSCEPLLGDLRELNLSEIDWVIAGGESGRNARPMKEEWVQNILEQCENTETPFFFKQWGGFNKKKHGRLLNGQTYDEWPSYAQYS